MDFTSCKDRLVQTDFSSGDRTRDGVRIVKGWIAIYS